MKSMQFALGTLVATLSIALAPAAQALEVAGVKVEERLQVSGNELVLNGAGLRTKVFFKVYVASLYVSKKSGSAEQLLDSTEPARMSLRMLREIDADTLYGALREGLAANVAEAELATLQNKLQLFAAIMRKVGTSHPGDTVSLDFHGDTVSVGFNGSVVGTLSAPRFGRVLLSIWLGDHPVEPGLKKALLGN